MSYSSCSVWAPPSAAFLCLIALAISGCGVGIAPTALNSQNPTFPAGGSTLKGQVQGGNQPYIDAAIDLYSVGTSGYGSAGTHLATTTTSAPYGSFAFTQNPVGTPGPTSPISATYTCPSSTTQLYIVSRGGSTQGVGNGTNSAAAFAVAIGQCGTASSVFVDINEVTSVATMAALQQYFNPVNETFGSPNTTQAIQGLANGVAAIGNLATRSTGSAVTSLTASAVPHGSTNTITVIVTPETAQINTIANILAACVNTTSNTSTTCGTLFADAVPPNSAYTSQPTQIFTSITASNEDTLQALYFMMTNPASGGVAANMTGLFGLVTAAGAPFQPAYAATTTDWTIGIYYDGGTYGATAGKCVPNTPSTSYGTASNASYLGGVQQIAVDVSGNLWMQSGGTNGDLYEMSPTGTPLACTLGAMLGASGSLGGVAIDSNGYIWAIGSGTSVFKVNPTTAALDSTWPATAPSGNLKPRGIAADDNGNIFYTTAQGSPSQGYVYEFVGAATTPSSVTIAQQIAANLTASNLLTLQADTSGRIWAPIQSATIAELDEIYPSTGTGNLNGYLTYNTASSANGGAYLMDTYYISVGPSYIYTTNTAGTTTTNTIGFITANASPSLTVVTASAQNAGGLNGSHGVAVDGAGNAWALGASAGNWISGSTTSLPSVAEISATGASITAAGNKGGIQKPSAFSSFSYRGAAIDPTGNVWFGANSSSASTRIYELVGAAVPTVTPLSSINLGQIP